MMDGREKERQKKEKVKTKKTCDIVPNWQNNQSIVWFGLRLEIIDDDDHHESNVYILTSQTMFITYRYTYSNPYLLLLLLLIVFLFPFFCWSYQVWQLLWKITTTTAAVAAIPLIHFCCRNCLAHIHTDKRARTCKRCQHMETKTMTKIVTLL